MAYLSLSKKASESLKRKAGIRSTARFGIPLIFALMVMLSPTITFVSPVSIASAAAAPTDLSGHWASPSTISQDGNDFTTQAALSSVSARPTNNIVNTNSFYDVVFVTATAGAIKTIQVTFPAGTTIASSAFFNEAEGIGPGTASKTGQTITYTVNNAVNVPAGTKIRLEFANINNPLNAGASYKVTVTTRNAANTPIDGPTPSTAYTMKQIGANVIADNAITNPKIADLSVSNSKLDPGSVSNSKLATSSVTSDKVFPGSFSLPVAQRPGTVVNLPQNSVQASLADCLPGEQVIAGGHDLGAANVNDFRIVDEFITGNSWRVSGNNAGGGAMSLQAFAICALDFPL
jgi:hypothetical protein